MNSIAENIKSVKELKIIAKEKQSQYYQEFKKKNPNYYKERNDKARINAFEKSFGTFRCS